MRRWIPHTLLLLLILAISGCAKNDEVVIVNTFEKTPSEDIEKRIENTEGVILETYYEMSDGTWKTDDYAYQYKLMVTGRLHNAVRDTT